MQIAIHTITTELNKDIEVNIFYDNIHVFSSFSKDEKTKYLNIKIRTEIEDSECVVVVPDRINWLKLLILDVLCFLTNEPFTLADFYSSETVIGNFDKEEKTIFLVNGKNLLPDLEIMIEQWEKSDKKTRNVLIFKMRMKRYNIIEKSGKEL